MNEIWKDIKDFEGLYQISNFGRVKSLPKYTYSKGYPQLRKEKILKLRFVGKYRNYLAVVLNDHHQYSVHRLVAQAFIPNPNNLPLVNHKDENPKNNHVNNLEWCDNRYNVKYSAKPLTKEHRQKISIAHLGKKLSYNHRKNISISIKQRYSDENERIRHSNRMKEWWHMRKEKVVNAEQGQTV